MNKNTIGDFWLKVNKDGIQTEYVTTPCWEWTGCLDSGGYGQFSWNGKKVLVHRFSYELSMGFTIPTGLEIDHLCKTRKCVNPSHLEVVTKTENLSRGNGAHKNQNTGTTICRRGHKFTPENTVLYHGSGKRACRICKNHGARMRRLSKIGGK